MGTAKKSLEFAVIKKIVTHRAIKHYKEEVLNTNEKELSKERLPRNVCALLFFQFKDYILKTQGVKTFYSESEVRERWAYIGDANTRLQSFYQNMLKMKGGGRRYRQIGGVDCAVLWDLKFVILKVLML
ncbi:hypothetical protein BUALT_Bualt06G0020900 [Buddleja alternifolia]|uniref:Uncharacterized protein n=1 Tax=Buddleja alternifolia TaxID=168488 RepID=A0AAV6XIY8_9LAMI|nr:hypothetical protein BUALT_Bualt06G0020900 [Buddleja alternifolia]